MSLSAKDIADRIKRPATTVRDWAVKFGDFIPKQQKGRYPTYSESTVVVFEKIQALLGKGLTSDQVREQLSKEYGLYQDGEETEPTETSKQLVVSQEFNAFLSGFNRLFEQQQKVIDLLLEQNQILKQNIAKNDLTTSPKTDDYKASGHSTPTKAKHKRKSNKVVKKKLRKTEPVKKGKSKSKKPKWWSWFFED